MPKAWHRRENDRAHAPSQTPPGSLERARAQRGQAQQHTMDENSLSARRRKREQQQEKEQRERSPPKSPRERVLPPESEMRRRINQPRDYRQAINAPPSLQAYQEQLRRIMQLEVYDCALYYNLVEPITHSPLPFILAFSSHVLLYSNTNARHWPLIQVMLSKVHGTVGAHASKSEALLQEIKEQKKSAQMQEIEMQGAYLVIIPSGGVLFVLVPLPIRRCQYCYAHVCAADCQQLQLIMIQPGPHSLK